MLVHVAPPAWDHPIPDPHRDPRFWPHAWACYDPGDTKALSGRVCQLVITLIKNGTALPSTNLLAHQMDTSNPLSVGLSTKPPLIHW